MEKPATDDAILSKPARSVNALFTLIPLGRWQSK